MQLLPEEAGQAPHALSINNLMNTLKTDPFDPAESAFYLTLHSCLSISLVLYLLLVSSLTIIAIPATSRQE